MKLELKHLAPYLPYGLEMLSEDKIHVLKVATFSYRLHDSMPILRPLLDLTKDVQDNGRYLIEDIIRDTEMPCDAYDEWSDSFIDNPEQSRIIQAPHDVFEELLKRHFDVFGLIPEGLAIDINTIEK